MARTGRPRIPTRLKIINGNPGKRPQDIDTGEPEPESVIPSCPAFLKDEARKEWRRVTKQLHILGLISRMDRALLVLYCVQWARFVEAEEKIAAEPTKIYKTESGYPIQSPWLGISNKALEQLCKIATEFGFTPASRTRIKVEKPKEVDPLTDFMKRKPTGTTGV